jgi:hypothetical protein
MGEFEGPCPKRDLSRCAGMPAGQPILRLAILWYKRSFSRMAETSEDGTPQVQRIYLEPQPPYGRFQMRGSRILLCAAALLTTLALASAPAANAQIVIGVRVPTVGIAIGVQPVCSYGYYGYAPYACAPYGYYGPGYFYNGIFLGMGPWANWGYGHGWGGHRFGGGGGGRYVGGAGGARGSAGVRTAAVSRGRTGGAAVVRTSASSRSVAPSGGSHAAVARSGGAAPHASGGAAPHASGGAAPHASGGAARGGSGSGGGGGQHR